MIPSQTFENYPVFGDNATKVQPDGAKYSSGYTEGDVYPAEWVNWFWAKSSQGVSELQAGAESMEAEINAVLTGAGKTPDVNENNQLLLSIQKLISDAETRAKLAAHPVGSLYWSSQNTDPSTLFGGTWQRIKDKFIWAAGDSDTINATGGAKTVTLSINNLPSHNHTFTGSEVTSGANSRGHTHTGPSHHHVLNAGNTPTAGTAVTAGIRFVAVTSGGSSATNTGAESSHTHDMQHYHSRGTMEITGKISNAGGTFGVLGFESGSGAFSGAFSGATFSGKSRTGEGGSSSAKVVNFTASSNWTGLTSNSLTSDSAAKNSTGAGSSHSHTMAHTHSVTANGYIYGNTNAAGTGNTGDESQNHTHKVTAAGTIGNSGSGTAVDKMPPYVVKYCWERTA